MSESDEDIIGNRGRRRRTIDSDIKKAKKKKKLERQAEERFFEKLHKREMSNMYAGKPIKSYASQKEGKKRTTSGHRFRTTKGRLFEVRRVGNKKQVFEIHAGMAQSREPDPDCDWPTKEAYTLEHVNEYDNSAKKWVQHEVKPSDRLAKVGTRCYKPCADDRSRVTYRDKKTKLLTTRCLAPGSSIRTRDDSARARVRRKYTVKQKNKEDEEELDHNLVLKHHSKDHKGGAYKAGDAYYGLPTREYQRRAARVHKRKYKEGSKAKRLYYMKDENTGQFVKVYKDAPKTYMSKRPEKIKRKRSADYKKSPKQALWEEVLLDYQRNNPGAKWPRKGTSEYAELRGIYDEGLKTIEAEIEADARERALKKGGERPGRQLVPYDGDKSSTLQNFAQQYVDIQFADGMEDYISSDAFVREMKTATGMTATKEEASDALKLAVDNVIDLGEEPEVYDVVSDDDDEDTIGNRGRRRAIVSESDDDDDGDVPMPTDLIGLDVDSGGSEDECQEIMCDRGLRNRRDFIKWGARGGHPDKGGDTALFQDALNCKESGQYCKN